MNGRFLVAEWRRRWAGLRLGLGAARRRLGESRRRVEAAPRLQLPLAAARNLLRNDATHMAAGLAFYGILSLFPFTAGLILLLSLVLESATVQADVIDFFQTYLPGSAGVLQDNLRAVDNGRGALGTLSVVGLFWSTGAFFTAMSRVVNRAWGRPGARGFFSVRLQQLWLILLMALLFLISLAATGMLQALERFALPGAALLRNDALNLAGRLLPFGFTLAIFLIIYKFIPEAPCRWRYVWPGALLAAACFEAAKSLFVFYLENFANLELVYGSLSSVIALLVWSYASAFILIAGAEFTAEYHRRAVGN